MRSTYRLSYGPGVSLSFFLSNNKIYNENGKQQTQVWSETAAVPTSYLSSQQSPYRMNTPLRP